MTTPINLKKMPFLEKVSHINFNFDFKSPRKNSYQDGNSFTPTIKVKTEPNV